MAWGAKPGTKTRKAKPVKLPEAMPREGYPLGKSDWVGQPTGPGNPPWRTEND